MFKSICVLNMCMTRRFFAIFILVVLLSLSLSLVSCGHEEIYTCRDGTIAGNRVVDLGANNVFVCPDGSKVRSLNSCDFDVVASISQDSAEEKAISYVSGYTTSNGWMTKFVNSYEEEGHWYAQLVLSKYDEQAYQTTVKIDGERGVVTCIENCAYTEA